MADRGSNDEERIFASWKAECARRNILCASPRDGADKEPLAKAGISLAYLELLASSVAKLKLEDGSTASLCSSLLVAASCKRR